MEKFSVLMSVYHKETPEYFDIALEHILIGQTLRPDEFVLVCDGELTPGLESIIEKYKALFPDTFKVFRKENGGLGKALNFGLEKCSYPLVARADSDDVCVSDRFEKQVRYFEEHPDVGIISAYIDEFDTDWTSPTAIKELPLEHEDLLEWIKFRNPFNHNVVMFRRDDILRIGSYHHLPYMEDHDLWLRAIVAGIRIANIGEVLLHMRVGNGMIQRRSTRKYISGYHTIGRYMVRHGLCNNWIYLRNMVAVTGFVLMPDSLRAFVYRKILRKKI